MNLFKLTGNSNSKFCLIVLLWVIATCPRAETQTLEGRYYLYGVMEMTAGLQLEKDGTFTAGVEYGSASGFAKGKWYVEDDVLTLESEPTLRPAHELAFDSFRERPKSALLQYAIQNKYSPLDFWTRHYILEMRYARYREPPRIKPEFVHFQFDHGPAASIKLTADPSSRALLHYDPERTITKVGLSTSQIATPTRWFDLAPSSRMFNLWWKKPTNQPITYTEPDEFTLAEAHRRLEEQDAQQIDTHYLVEVFHYDPMKPPPIKPVTVYWQFKDGSTVSSVWTDSGQERIALPYQANKDLEKVGVRMEGATEAIEWFEVTPEARWLIVEWDAKPNPAYGELSDLFQYLQLDVTPGCLALEIGGSTGCFRPG